MPETAEPVVDALRKNQFCSDERIEEGLEIQRKMREMGVNPKPLAEILLDKGYITKDQFQQVAGRVMDGKSTLDRDSIPGYELLKKLGQGGMGAVFQARQVSMDRIVALKVLPPKLARDGQFRERFLREARAVAKLNHENIIQGIDVGTANGLYYFVMEFVDGRPVSKRLAESGPLPEKEALGICQQIARALEHANRHKLVHRDVKPENIMVTSEGVAKLCDLGLAKQETGDTGLTQAGLSVGTPNYISPEQARGEADVDIRSDVYSLGASLYHMLTGKVPFEGTVPSVVMTKHITEELVPPSAHRPDLSPEAVAIVMKSMEKYREARYQEPGAMAADLEAAVAGRPLLHARAARKSIVPSVPAAGAPGTAAASRDSGAEQRRLHHGGHHVAPAKKGSPAVPIAVASVVALAILGGVIAMKNRTPKDGGGPGPVASNPEGGGKPVVDNPVGGGPKPPAIDLNALKEKKIQEAFDTLVEYVTANQADPAKHREIENRLEEFIAEHKKTAWENRAIAEQKKFREGLDKSASALLDRIRAEVAPIRADGRLWEAYAAAEGKWMRHLDATPTAKAFEELLAAIDAEMNAKWTGDRDAAKGLSDRKEFDKAAAALDGVKKYASPKLLAEAETLRGEIRKAAEAYAASLAELGRKRYDSEFWPGLVKLLAERKHKDALTHCGKFLSDPEMIAVKDRIAAMIDDVTSLNLVMSDAARGADTAIQTKERVTITRFDVRLTRREGDVVHFDFPNGGSSQIDLRRANEEDLAALCAVSLNSLPPDRKTAERGPFAFRIGLLFFFSGDDKDLKRAGEEMEKASREGVARARWYLDRISEKGMGESELAAKKLHEDAIGAFDGKKYGEAKQKLQRLLSDFAATAWVKDRKGEIQKKISECEAKLGGGPSPEGLASLIKGTIVETYPRGAVVVKYDFSNADQLQDWVSEQGKWTWDKETQSLLGVADAAVARGVHWTVPLAGDVSFQMELTPLQEKNIAIAVHSDQAGHSYIAMLGPDYGQQLMQVLGNPTLEPVSLAKLNQDGRPAFQVLGGAGAPKLVKGQKMTVRVSRAGKNLSVSVNDRRVAEAQDEAFTKGSVAIWLNDSSARIDEITIYGTPDPAWLKGKLGGK